MNKHVLAGVVRVARRDVRPCRPTRSISIGIAPVPSKEHTARAGRARLCQHIPLEQQAGRVRRVSGAHTCRVSCHTDGRCSHNAYSHPHCCKCLLMVYDEILLVLFARGGADHLRSEQKQHFGDSWGKISLLVTVFGIQDNDIFVNL